MPSFVVFPDTQHRLQHRMQRCRSGHGGSRTGSTPTASSPSPRTTGRSCPDGACTPPSALHQRRPARTRGRSGGALASTTCASWCPSPCSCTATSCADTRSPPTPSGGSWPPSRCTPKSSATGGRSSCAPTPSPACPACLSGTCRSATGPPRELGLEIVLQTGRMLSELEVYAARRRGSPQRGLSTVTAFVVPGTVRLLVYAATPTRGKSFSSSDKESSTFKSATQGQMVLRYAPHPQQ